MAPPSRPSQAFQNSEFGLSFSDRLKVRTKGTEISVGITDNALMEPEWDRRLMHQQDKSFQVDKTSEQKRQPL